MVPGYDFADLPDGCHNMQGKILDLIQLQSQDAAVLKVDTTTHIGE